MASAMRVFRKFRASDGRIKAATAIGVLALVSAVAAFGIMPALANHDGEELSARVAPDPLNYGGGSGGCDAAGSVADYELWINNPKPGVETYEGTDPDGTTFTLTVTEDDFYFDFAVEAGSSMGVLDVTVNGGQKSLHYDYDGKLHPVLADDNLHAPGKGGSGNLYNLSHVNICYEELEPGSVSGTKYHDRDVDGTKDATEESGLEGWTVAALDSNGVTVASDVTDADGFYTIDALDPGTYTICEQTGTSGLDLPTDSPDGVVWASAQSQPSDNTSGDCSNFAGYEPFGYTVEVVGNDAQGIDFGNHRQVSVTCGAENVTVTLDGENDEPAASVTFPAGCLSGVGDNPPYVTSFDLGLSDDTDVWDQFVVFGGDPTSDQVLQQTIVWAPEMLDPNQEDPPFYNANNQLVVSTTKVLLDLTGDVPDDLVDVTFCHEFTDEKPTMAVPQCLDSRTIAEGGDVPDDHIQVTEHYKLLGDPGNFR